VTTIQTGISTKNSLWSVCHFRSGVQRGGGERGADPGHPRQGGIQRV